MATRQTLEQTFAIVEAAAVAGERCPVSSNSGGPIMPGNVSALARAGRLAVEVSGRNWRMVTILTGPHAGKSTLPNPDPRRRKPYLTIDKRGTMRNGKLIDTGTGRRPQPSLPRPLTREELA